MSPYLIIMGVAGCGKSSLGQGCAAALSLPLLEGDDFHPEGNLRKMRSGLPLDDEDRWEWLNILGQRLSALPKGGILTCSALKRRYRDRLRNAVPEVKFVFLELPPHEAKHRVAARPNHIFPVSLVDSQYQILEDPRHEPGVLTLDAIRPLPDLINAVQTWLAGAPSTLET